MSDQDRRKFQRLDDLSNTPVEALVEDDGSFLPVVGARLVNHSEGGVQLVVDIKSSLTIGRTIVIFISSGSPPQRKRMETSVSWIREADGHIIIGCEYAYPMMGVPYYF